jgi:ElaB/YqjD/DUF883 family membrane-anchored ribosome-binding protein
MGSSESGTANGQRVEKGSARRGGALTVGQRASRAGATAEDAWSRTRETANEIKDRLEIDRRVAEHPYGMIAAAVGVGYVLGGGFFTPLTARVLGLGLRLGLRIAAIPLLEQELRGFAEAVVGGASDGQDGEDGETNEAADGEEGDKKSHQSRGTTKGGKGQ